MPRVLVPKISSLRCVWAARAISGPLAGPWYEHEWQFYYHFDNMSNWCVGLCFGWINKDCLRQISTPCCAHHNTFKHMFSTSRPDPFLLRKAQKRGVSTNLALRQNCNLSLYQQCYHTLFCSGAKNWHYHEWKHPSYISCNHTVLQRDRDIHYTTNSRYWW